MNTNVKLVGIGLLICLLFSLVASAVYMNNTTIRMTLPLSPYSYVIGQYNNTHFFMQNQTGFGYASYMGYQYMSNDAFKVINFAIGNMTTGTVFLKAGTYPSTASNPTIYLKTKVSLYGESSSSTILKCGNSVSKTVIKFKASSTNHYITVSDLWIEGNEGNNANTTAYGLHLDGLERSTLQNLVINGTCSDGMRLEDTTSGTYYAWQNSFSNIKIYYAGEGGTGNGITFNNYTPDNVLSTVFVGACDQYGIYFSSSGNRHVIGSHVWGSGLDGLYAVGTNRDKITNCEFETNDHNGIRFSGCSNFVIDANTIWSNSQNPVHTYDGIVIRDVTSTTYGQNATISSNIIYNTASQHTQNYALNVTQVAPGEIDNLIIIGNRLQSVSGSFVKTGTINIFAYANPGFVTESCASQASCINGTTITHGLFGTPTGVTLVMVGNTRINNTCYFLTPSVFSLGATTFTICFNIFNAGTITGVAAANAKTILWTATYKP